MTENSEFVKLFPPNIQKFERKLICKLFSSDFFWTRWKKSNFGLKFNESLCFADIEVQRERNFIVDMLRCHWTELNYELLTNITKFSELWKIHQKLFENDAFLLSDNTVVGTATTINGIVITPIYSFFRVGYNKTVIDDMCSRWVYRPSEKYIPSIQYK